MQDLKQLVANSFIKASEAARRAVSNWHYNYGHPKTTFAKKSERLVEDVDSLAAFASYLLDETPADEEWLDGVYPPTDDGWQRFQLYKNGSCYFCSRDVASTFIGMNVNRGRVRAFAFGVGLQLREGEG